jgi:hypothetical protein
MLSGLANATYHAFVDFGNTLTSPPLNRGQPMPKFSWPCKRGELAWLYFLPPSEFGKIRTSYIHHALQKITGGTDDKQEQQHCANNAISRERKTGSGIVGGAISDRPLPAGSTPDARSRVRMRLKPFSAWDVILPETLAHPLRRFNPCAPPPYGAFFARAFSSVGASSLPRNDSPSAIILPVSPSTRNACGMDSMK